jgi:hypothetical protein
LGKGVANTFFLLFGLSGFGGSRRKMSQFLASVDILKAKSGFYKIEGVLRLAFICASIWHLGVRMRRAFLLGPNLGHFSRLPDSQKHDQTYFANSRRSNRAETAEVRGDYVREAAR